MSRSVSIEVDREEAFDMIVMLNSLSHSLRDGFITETEVDSVEEFIETLGEAAGSDSLAQKTIRNFREKADA